MKLYSLLFRISKNETLRVEPVRARNLACAKIVARNFCAGDAEFLDWDELNRWHDTGEAVIEGRPYSTPSQSNNKS